MKFVVWGAGLWGERMVKTLQDHELGAFIDSNKEKQGKDYIGYPVISLERYLKEYRDYHIYIAIDDPKAWQSVEKILKENNIRDYFLSINNPSEISLPRIGGIPFKEMLDEAGVDNKTVDIAIDGENLFSFLLYHYMKKEGYKNISMVSGDNSVWEEIYGKKIKFIKRDTKTYKENIILITNRDKGRVSKSKGLKKNEKLFYSFYFLKRYHSPRMEQFKNIHADRERCFLVMTGPSLRIEDLDRLHDSGEITFGVNRSYIAFNQTKWRPDYYVCIDGYVQQENARDIIDMDLPVKFLCDFSDEFWDQYGAEIESHPEIYKYHFTWDQYYRDGPEFMDDLTQGTYGAESVVYDCFQLAVYMGFKKIYLIGADCSYIGNGYTEGDHFIKGYGNYGGKDTNKYNTNLEKLFVDYISVKEATKKRGVKIYNSTRGGALEVFERIDFDSLF